MMSEYPFKIYTPLTFPEEIMLERSQSFYELMDKRRTVRDFSNKPIDHRIIENCIKTANTAPSGANKQPWTFCVVSNPEIKKQISEIRRKRFKRWKLYKCK